MRLVIERSCIKLSQAGAWDFLFAAVGNADLSNNVESYRTDPKMSVIKPPLLF
jgi:hypothetical protein